jgi:hypothetical protein
LLDGHLAGDAHLGSCRKISEEDALQKARAMKAESLGV